MTTKLQEMYADIYNLRIELERVRKPLGTRENPVRTCRDLFYGNPHFKDGKPFLSLLFSLIIHSDDLRAALMNTAAD